MMDCPKCGDAMIWPVDMGIKRLGDRYYRQWLCRDCFQKQVEQDKCKAAKAAGGK